jgi:hypothetical protein
VGDIEMIEQSLIALRRSQRRRTLARLSGAPSDPAVEVIDVIEAAELAGKPATVSAVADALNIDQPRASKLVAAAVEAGPVVPGQDPGRRGSDRAGARLPAQADQLGSVLVGSERYRGSRAVA